MMEQQGPQQRMMLRLMQPFLILMMLVCGVLIIMWCIDQAWIGSTSMNVWNVQEMHGRLKGDNYIIYQDWKKSWTLEIAKTTRAPRVGETCVMWEQGPELLNVTCGNETIYPKRKNETGD